MITPKDIDALEERVTRMFPHIDVTAVNVIRREIQFLRDLANQPCCIEVSATKKTEAKKAKLLQPQEPLNEQVPNKDSLSS